MLDEIILHVNAKGNPLYGSRGQCKIMTCELVLDLHPKGQEALWLLSSIHEVESYWEPKV